MRQKQCGKSETVRDEMDLGLLRMERLMRALGDPQRRVPVIHVAGTNGKGSTCTFIAAMLKEMGIRTGLYCSPAVYDPLEIIQTDGKNISETDYRKLFEELSEMGAQLSDDEGSCPTIFEIQTAMAYTYFFRTGCEIAVIECGLGGDLDATNVTDSTVAAVFTPISLDHTALLGGTLAEIAGHKSGIMKRGVPVFTAAQEPEVMQVLREKARALGCALHTAPLPRAKLGADGCCRLALLDGACCTLGLAGSYQAENAMLAVDVLCELCRQADGGPAGLSEETFWQAVRAGLQNARLFGRMECIGHEPDIILDGAHNPGAARRLRQALSEAYHDTPRIFVMGAFSDKDYMQVARIVIEHEICVLALRAPGARGEEAQVLSEKLRGITPFAAGAYTDIDEALAAALQRAASYHQEKGIYPVIVCFGSLSWLAAAKDACHRFRRDI